MRFHKTIAAFVAILGVSSSALGQNTDNYPRLGEHTIGGAQNYDSTYQTYAAHIHINIIGGGWAGWEASRGHSKQSIVASIHAQSTINSRVIQYFSLDEAASNASTSSNPVIANQWNNLNWWLYANGTSGTMLVLSGGGAGEYETNMTAAAPLDPATGLGPYAWGAKYVNDLFRLGLYAGTSPAPSLDGFGLDNVFWEPRVTGDWTRNGNPQPPSDPTTQLNFRTGERAYFDYLTANFPSGLFYGNVADWWQNNGPGGVASITPLNGALGGGMFEGAIGASYSTDTTAGSLAMQQQYAFQISNLKSPQALIVSQEVTSTGSDPYGPNWQAMRYGICATLMNNGYYYPNLPGEAYDESAASRLWFDEMSGGGTMNLATGVLTGGLGVGYLGQPSAGAAGAVQTAAWSNGVWKREFANGIVLWNPKGNGAQTVSLSGLANLKHFSGSQNPSLNNGAPVTGSVTLQDRDGVILMRLTPVVIPDSPSALKLKVN